MPSEAFYEGLTLAEQVQKFLDHHYAKKTRHISAYEAQMLDRARTRIEQTLEIATREAAAELRSVYETLLQVYETVVSGDSHVVAVHSFPVWHLEDPSAVVEAAGLAELARDPSPSQVQALLATLVTSADPQGLADRYEDLLADSEAVERELDPEALSVLNRILYLPTVVAENSWADVAPLLDHLAKAKEKGTPVLVFGGTVIATGNVVLAFLAGSSCIALQLLQSLADGMRPGIRELGARLTGSWRSDEAGSAKAVGSVYSATPALSELKDSRSLPPGSGDDES